MKKIFALLSRENAALYVTLIAVFVLMSVLNGGKFVSVDNLSSMAYQLPLIGLLSVGMMIAMLTGGINLSIIANANFNGVIIWLVLEGVMGKGKMHEAGIGLILLAILAGFVGSAAIGFINGFLISIFDISAILVTLGTMTLVNGVTIAITRGYTVSGFPEALTWIGNGVIPGVSIPVSIVLFALAVLVAAVILNRTRFGFSLYMMGANPVAAEYSNVDIPKITIMQYMLSSVFASLTSLVMIGQFNSVKANYAESYLLVAVLASFFGGVDPLGGFGRISGVVVATIILQLISSGLTLLRMDPFLITAMWGAIVIVIIFARAVAGVVKRRWNAAE